MSVGPRVSLAEGRAAADSLRLVFGPACERIEVAGSIRRGKPDVGDIELVAVPRVEMVPDGLFDGRAVNRLTEILDRLIVDGLLGTHPTDPKRGERYSKLIHRPSGLQVDLFSATRDTFGLIFLIRTGPADYSHRFVTALRKRALHVASGQLHRGSLGCGSYVCGVVPTPTEEDVYLAADWPFLAPESRT